MTPIKLLILTANPTLSSQAPLRLDAEVRLIEEALRRSQYRDRFEILTKLATRTTDLRRSLLDYRPQIVHFSGHGTGENGLVLETDSGQMHKVSNEALTQLFSIFAAGEIECVLLNACYSEVQAIAIHQFVDCVIGMNQPIDDLAAVQFAEGFYDALGAGSLYDEAFRIGCSAIALSDSPGASIPVLKYRPRPNALSDARSNVLLNVLPSAQLSSNANDKLAAAQSRPADLTAQRPSQSQSIGNVTISGNNNPFNAVQAGQDVVINHQTQTQAASVELQAVVDAVGQLREAIARANEIDETEKAMAEIPLKKMEAEVQKAQPDWTVVDKMMSTLQKTLDGVASLVNPMTKIVALVARVGIVL